MAKAQHNDGKQARASELRQSSGRRSHKKGDRSHIYLAGRIDVHPSAPEWLGRCVYIMQTAQGLIKIGQTGALLSRHHALHDLVPTEHRPIRLVRAVRMADAMAYRVERQTIQLLSEYRAKLGDFTEWFDITPTRAGRALNKAIRSYGIDVKREWLYVHFPVKDK